MNKNIEDLKREILELERKISLIQKIQKEFIFILQQGIDLMKKTI